jgi:hypothetical protein
VLPQVAVSDANHVFVLWQGSGTNLSPVQQGAKASFHESHMTGVDVITFNKDRSKILEVRGEGGRGRLQGRLLCCGAGSCG